MTEMRRDVPPLVPVGEGQQDKPQRPPLFDAGDAVDSDLTVVDHLGGTAKVDLFLCRSKKLNELVACKVLLPPWRVHFKSLEDFLQEGEMQMKLHHPHVIEGHSVELLPHPRIVMEYLPGQTIGDAFFEGNFAAFDLEDTVDVVFQLADALTYVHQAGILHLDVKPGNVMYDDGHVTLFDFSVAEYYSPDDPFKDNAGTRKYMAPEQTFRKEVGYATDVFGMGVVFYRLLTGGERPYPEIKEEREGEDRPRKRLDYTDQPKPPSEIDPTVPESISAVALTALEPDADKRFPTPEEFANALSRAWEELD